MSGTGIDPILQDEPKILSNLAWIPDEIPRRYFLYFMSSQPFHAQDLCNFDKKNTLLQHLVREIAQNSLPEKFFSKLRLHATTFFFIYLLIYLYLSHI